MPFKKTVIVLTAGAAFFLCGALEPVSAQCPRWRRVDVGQATIPMQAVYAYDSLYIWASTAFGDVLHTKDGGLSWNKFSLIGCCPPLQGGIAKSFSFFDTLNGWIAGEAENGPPPAGSFRLHTSDGGNSWTTQLDTGTNWGGQIQFLNKRKGFDLIGHACNFKDSFLVTNDSGNTWQLRKTGIPACAIGYFLFVDSLNGWGEFQHPPPQNFFGLMRTRDGGNSWTELPVPSNFNYYCFGARIAFVDTLNGWMWHCEPNDLTRSRFSRTRDGGVTWDSLFTFISDYRFYSLEVLDGAHIWLAGSNVGYATVQFSSDGGNSWTEQMPGVGDPIWGLDVFDSLHASAIGANGYVYIYSPAPLNGLIGDLNQDSLLSAADVVLLLNRTFLDSSVCVPMTYIDFNNDCKVTPADVALFLIRVFAGGPSLQAGCVGP